MAWKIEIFPDVNNPKRLDVQVLATAEDMTTAREVVGWLNWDDLVETFVLIDQGTHKDAPSETLLSYPLPIAALPQPSLEDVQKKYADPAPRKGR